MTRENLQELSPRRHDTTQAMDAESEDKGEQDEETGDSQAAKGGDDQDLNMDVEEEFEDENLDQSMEPAILRLCPEVLALIFHYVYVTPVVRRPTKTEKATEPRPEGTDPGQESAQSTPSSSSPSSLSPDLSAGDSSMEALTEPTTTTTATTTILVTATSESDPRPTTTNDNSTAGVQKRKVKSTVYIQNDLSSMLALCLTCRAFYPQAVRLLWRQRTLANDDDLAEFYQAIDFSQSLRKRHQKQRQQREQQRQRLGMGYAMEEGLFNNEAALRIKSLTLLDMSLTTSPISSSRGAKTSSSTSSALPLEATSAVVGSSSSGSSSLGSDPVQALSSQFFGSSSSSHGDSNYPLAGSAGLNLCRGIDSLTGGSTMIMDESLAQIHQSYGLDKEQAQASWAAASSPTSTASSPIGSPILSKRRLRQKTSSIYSDMVSPRLLHAIANHCYALVDLTICMDKKPTSLTFAPAFQPTIAFSILAGSLLSLKRLTLMGLVCDPNQNKTGSELLLFAQQAQPLERISIRTCQGISLETYLEWAIRSKGSLLSVDFQGLDFESSQDLTDMMGAFAFHCRSLSSITLSCMNALSLDGMMEAFAYYRAFQIQELHVLGHDTFRTTQQAAAAAAHPAAPGVVDGAAAGLAAPHLPQANPEGLATVPVTQLCHVSDANVAMAHLAQLSLRRLTLYCPGITDYALVQYVSRSPQLIDLVLNEPTTLLQLPQFHQFVQLNAPPASSAPTTAENTHSPTATAGASMLTPSPPSPQPFTSAVFFTILLKKSPWLKYIFMKLTLDTAQEWIAQPCFKELGLEKCLYQYRTATGAPAVVLMWDTRGSNARVA